MADTHSDVAVFWDFESCPASPSSSGYDVVDNVRSLALRFGVIKAFRTYLAVSDRQYTNFTGGNPRTHTLRSELQSSGVSLMDVPYGKDAIGKTLLVDMLTYALDHLPTRIVLLVITADHLLAYALSVLRMRNYRVVVLTPETVSSSPLISQAAICFNWDGNTRENHVVQPPASPGSGSKGQEPLGSSACQGEGRAARPVTSPLGTGVTETLSLPLDKASAYNIPISNSTQDPMDVDVQVAFPDSLPHREGDEGENNDPLLETVKHGVQGDSAGGDVGELLNFPEDGAEEIVRGTASSRGGMDQKGELPRQEEGGPATRSIPQMDESGGAGVDPVPMNHAATVDCHASCGHPMASNKSLPSSSSMLNSLGEAPSGSTSAHPRPNCATSTLSSESSFLSPSSPSSALSPLLTSTSNPQSFTLPNDVQESKRFAPSVTAGSTASTIPMLTEKESPSQNIFTPPSLPDRPNFVEFDHPSPTPDYLSASRLWLPPTAGEKKGIPAHFAVLMEVMADCQREGVTRVARSFLGCELPNRQPNIYAECGIADSERPLEVYLDTAIDQGFLMRDSEEHVFLGKPPQPEPQPRSKRSARVKLSSTPSASTPTSSTRSAATNTNAEKPHFKVFLEIMQEYQDKGQTSVGRDLLSDTVRQRHPNFYLLAGLCNSRAPLNGCIDSAIDAGILVRGDHDADVSLPGPKTSAKPTTQASRRDGRRTGRRR